MISINHRRCKTPVNIGASEPGGLPKARDISENVPQAPRFVPSLVALAGALGVTRQSLIRWRREPGAPEKRSDGRYEVAPWKVFLMNRPAYGGGPSGYREKCRKIQLQNEKLQWEIEELKRNYTATVDVEKWGAKLASQIREVVSIIAKVAPEVVGLNVPNAESRLKRLEDELLQGLHTLK